MRISPWVTEPRGLPSPIVAGLPDRPRATVQLRTVVGRKHGRLSGHSRRLALRGVSFPFFGRLGSGAGRSAKPGGLGAGVARGNSPRMDGAGLEGNCAAWAGCGPGERLWPAVGRER